MEIGVFSRNQPPVLKVCPLPPKSAQGEKNKKTVFSHKKNRHLRVFSAMQAEAQPITGDHS